MKCLLISFLAVFLGYIQMNANPKTKGSLPADSDTSFNAPNIVVILSDNHRWDAAGYQNHPFIKTPALDRLANEGVVFENAFCTTSLCSPSRASFLTGTYPHTHGVKNNLTPWTDKAPIFLELLAKAGYSVAFIGKWHMPGEGLPDLPFLDRFVSFTIQSGQGRYFDCPLVVDGKKVASRKEYIADELTDYALEFIETALTKAKTTNQPFCVYLSHKSVHHAFLPPRDLDGMYDSVDIEMPEGYDPWLSMTNGHIFSGTMGSLKEHYRDYCEAVVGMDRQIGRLLDRLDQSGLYDSTVVIYVSDNGMMWGEHRKIDMNWPYEESIRIPMIIRYPGLIKNTGLRLSQMALNIDIAPTVLELASIGVPEIMEGMSLVPFLVNPEAEGRTLWLYEYYKDFPYNIPTTFGIRTNRFKYMDYNGRMKDLFFDLLEDPTEDRNLIDEEDTKQDLQEMQKMLNEMKAKYGLD